MHLTISHFEIISLLPIFPCNNIAEIYVLATKSFHMSIIVLLHILKLETLGLTFYLF